MAKKKSTRKKTTKKTVKKVAKKQTKSVKKVVSKKARALALGYPETMNGKVLNEFGGYTYPNK